jgi:hypothetical protein
MSITQVSNNRPAGSTAKSCDAGIPIVGRTSSTGVYEILKVNSDGSLPLAANGTFITGVPTPQTPNSTANPITGVKAVDLVLGYQAINTSPVTAGIYKINPFFICSATALGAVNFMLIKGGTPLDVYTVSRNPFVDGFAPSINDFNLGYTAFWHNVVNQNMGGNNALAYNRSNELEVYLEAGIYWLLITVHTNITMNAGANYSGFYTFNQL